jgi:dienelactone hydrolase
VYADALATWDYLTKTRGVPPDQVVLYGYSLGGAVATELATQNSPAGLITEGAF